MMMYVTSGTIVSDDGNPNGLDANTNCELSMPFFIIDNPVNNFLNIMFNPSGTNYPK
jgi:hypothetical protein